MKLLKHDFEITEKLPKEFKDKWVKALRSGDYEQGIDYLHSNNKFCCLGVSCIISGYKTTDLKIATVIKKGVHESYLDRNFRKIPKIIKGDSSKNDIVGLLTDANDNGYSFEVIANWIEKYL